MAKWQASKIPYAAAAFLFATCLYMLLYHTVQWFQLAFRALNYPFELDLAEGIVWQQADMLLDGRGYGDISNPPFVVFHYPPIYHLVSALMAEISGTDFLAGGRAVSMLAAISSAALAAIPALVCQTCLPSARCIAAFFVLVLCISFEPIAHWSITARVDMLAVLFSLLSLQFGLAAHRGAMFKFLCALCVALAVYTKPTAISAPLSLLLFFALNNPRFAGSWLLWTLLIGVAFGLTAVMIFGEGFAIHILGYNVNRINLPNLWFMVFEIVIHCAFLLTAAFFAARFIIFEMIDRNLTRTEKSILPITPNPRLLFSIYFFITTLMTLAIVKSGADTNYLIEWFFACAIVIGLGLAQIFHFIQKGLWSRLGDTPIQDAQRSFDSRAPFILALSLLLAFQSFILIAPRVSQNFKEGQSLIEMQGLTSSIAASKQAVASEDMVLIRRAGKGVMFEPMIINEITAVGSWEEDRLVEMVKRKEFAFFITRSLDDVHAERGWPYSEKMTAAILAAYPSVFRTAGYWIRKP
jgi:hypothetical protein